MGRKTAQRIVLELREDHAAGIAVGPGEPPTRTSWPPLESLGYTASEARRRAAGTVATVEGGLDERIRAALQELAARMTPTEQETIERVLRETETWAVVGLSSNPTGRAGVARTLMQSGYRVIPVNPPREPRFTQRPFTTCSRHRTTRSPRATDRGGTSSATPSWHGSTWTKRSRSARRRSGCSSGSSTRRPRPNGPAGGPGGGPTSASGSGARSARTTATTATPGTTSRTTRPAHAPTAGARTAWAAISDDKQRLCFALALWNERDPILKERLFGLTNSEGNHGEDVKEYYFYLDSTPTHSYMKYLYKYPQREFPYAT